MIGERLGEFSVDRELGSGGMGRVFAATGPEGVVALKVVHPHLLETEDSLQRFLREAEIGQAVAHENVVRTLAHGEAAQDGASVAYLVMEYVEGQTLADLQGSSNGSPRSCVVTSAERCARGSVPFTRWGPSIAT